MLTSEECPSLQFYTAYARNINEFDVFNPIMR